VISPQVVVGNEEIFDAHVAGKLSVALKAPLDTQRALSIAYTPGVAQVGRAIAADHTLAARYTWANRLVAVVSDSSAVLGLGDIGPAAALPVMEGKSALFKAFGGLDSIPIVLTPRIPTRSSKPWCACGRLSAPSVSRTSPHRAASRSNAVPSRRWTAR
jgi:malate dehydrogenase (oxaloacetate-decarboxylating)